MTAHRPRSVGYLSAAAFLVAPLVAAPSLAQGRPQSVAMTCAQTVALVRSSGAIVLGTGGQTYDRYVRDRGFCEVTQTTKREFVPTRDQAACFVGYTCREYSPSDRFGFD